ncbi:hypothetical protein [Arthrobacter sp.]|uniref:hypothetical protein n=1 Tax=Arthrobacter sp. TaxID=1667 RepID=UPI003A8FA06C
MKPGDRVESTRPPHQHGTVILGVNLFPGMIRVQWDDGTRTFEGPEFLQPLRRA